MPDKLRCLVRISTSFVTVLFTGVACVLTPPFPITHSALSGTAVKCSKCTGNFAGDTCTACANGYYKDNKGVCTKCPTNCAAWCVFQQVVSRLLIAVVFVLASVPCVLTPPFLFTHSALSGTVVKCSKCTGNFVGDTCTACANGYYKDAKGVCTKGPTNCKAW